MIPFLFAVHSHQPEGNFGWVFEKAYNDCYHPFLEMVSEYEALKVSIHYSGCLLDWIESNRPAHVKLLKKLIKRGQVELLGGGYYEPILPSIPDRDALAQITSYRDRLAELFGKAPEGLWLAERVWDPDLPKLLSAAGVKFTLLDDSHFRYGGLRVEEVWGPFLAEREGRTVTILPIDKNLRYLIPFREPGEVVAYLRDRAKNTPGFVACYGDDTEKFGMWPGTKEWVFERGWLRRFFDTLTSVKDEIVTVHFSEYLAAARPRSRVYLPPASYEEMMEWVLPAGLGERFEDFAHELKNQNRWAELAPFVRGGHWDMFLAKYEEANRMHKRMILCSERMAQLPAVSREAKAELYRSQCNCAYWHGVFGGLYLSHLRHAVYQRVMSAEALAGLNQNLKIESFDYNCDGTAEIMVTSPGLNVFLDPAQGGTIIALEYPKKRFALGNLMGRRREAYHRKLKLATGQADGAPTTIHERVIVKEPGLEKYLIEDRFPRNSLQDHLLPVEVSLEELERETVPALSCFAGAPYQVLALTKNQVVLARVDQTREGPVRLEKTLEFKTDRAGFTAQYRLTSGGNHKISFRLALEFNLTLLADTAPDRYYRINGVKPADPVMISRGRDAGVNRLELVNEAEGFTVGLQPGPAAEVFRFPVYTVNLSESGFEKTYQGSALWFTWALELTPGREAAVALEFDVSDKA